jgi:predicted O-methyltransferase YrrM
MFQSIKIFLKKLKNPKKPLNIKYVKKSTNSWLCNHYNDGIIKPIFNDYIQKIENLASKTNNYGSQPLWEGYISGDPDNKRGNTRKSDQVRTDKDMGCFYTDLVCNKKPSIIVEFGTAFGISGMYFLSGLEKNGSGHMFTYEPNEIWAGFARHNLNEIGSRFKSTIGTFEENIDKDLVDNKKIDLAFIDAIHTSKFVFSQLDIIIQHSRSGTIIILDDINFSSDMQSCWETLSKDDRFIASAYVGNRVGIVEMK